MVEKRLNHKVLFYNGATASIMPPQEALKIANKESTTNEITLSVDLTVYYNSEGGRPICAFVNDEKLAEGIIDVIDVARDCMFIVCDDRDFSSADALSVFNLPKKTVIDGVEVIVLPVKQEIYAEILNFAFDDYEENVIRRV